jgi:hypothetical protein
VQPQFNKGPRLLVAAIEGMGNAARHADAAQVFEDDVLGAPHMQQDRQVKVARQLELLGKEEFLLFAQRRFLQGWHEEIQPDFANADEQRIVQRLGDGRAQDFKVRFLGGGHVEGMNAQRINSIADFAREPPDLLEIHFGDGGNDDGAHADLRGLGGHGSGTVAEFPGVEMAVRIDPHVLAWRKSERPAHRAQVPDDDTRNRGRDPVAQPGLIRLASPEASCCFNSIAGLDRLRRRQFTV